MCGIVGKVSYGGITQKDIDDIKNMSTAIAHRGPDSEGFYSDENVAFGHRRLSILDISTAANQPMTDDENTLVLIFNGEVYNHLEIRERLKSKYNFKTDHSDTETILYAYKEWGLECIKYFNGFFAIALYDKVKMETILIRDRMGKKPLFFTMSNNALYFSSEIHAFFKAGIVEKCINKEAIYNYLTFLTTNAPDTFFANIYKLECGHYLKITKNKIEKVKYWNIADFINVDNADNFLQATEKTEDLLVKSMKYRNIADVDIAIALSGGIDSSLNLFYSSKDGGKIDAINISYDADDVYDESEIAQKFSKELGVKFIKSIISANDFEVLAKEYITKQIDSPTGDVNSALLYFLSKLSKSNSLKVMIVGEGGDEMGGYPIYEKLNKEYNILKHFKNLNFMFKSLSEKFARKFDIFYNNDIISRRHIHGFTEFEKRSFWLGGESFNSYKILHDYMSEIRDDLKDSFLRKVLNVEYKMRLPELILQKIDYSTMSQSVEARSPFMDHFLIEYSSGLSFGTKMKYGAKSILKEIAKNKLPGYILNQPKVGFGMLLTPFLQNIMPIWYQQELLLKKAMIHEFISKIFLQKLLDGHTKYKNQGYKMWILFALEKWLEMNFDSKK